jgi:predicted O-methyltransferase YrrM
VRDYPDYLIAALRLLRPGGVVAFNNALLAGTVRDDDLAGGPDAAGFDDGPEVPDDEADLAAQVRSDDRLVPVLLPLGQGLLAALKRGD